MIDTFGIILTLACIICFYVQSKRTNNIVKKRIKSPIIKKGVKWFIILSYFTCFLMIIVLALSLININIYQSSYLFIVGILQFMFITALESLILLRDKIHQDQDKEFWEIIWEIFNDRNILYRLVYLVYLLLLIQILSLLLIVLIFY